MSKSHKRETRIVHAGSHPADHRGVINTPVYRASTVAFPTAQAMRDAVKTRYDKNFYGRLGTPTSFALEEAMCDLEGGYRTVSTPSGVAAVAVALSAFLKAGDHLLMVDTTYDPTRSHCTKYLAQFGVETTFYDPMIGADIDSLILDNTKLIFTESPGSLSFEVQDIPAIVDAAHKRGVRVILDNTWAGGYFFKPFEHGVDISVQAATKYIAGHSDVMIGLVTAATEKDWRRIKTTAALLGLCASPDDCYLTLRGMRTLDVRMGLHQENGLALANWFADRAEVNRVLHPAFPDCPGHDIWKRDFTGASGLFAIVLNDTPLDRVDAMLDGMELFAMGYSWGGFESLMIHTDPTAIRSANKWDAPGPLLRIHAGQEDVSDLIEDLERGFDRLNAKP